MDTDNDHLQKVKEIYINDDPNDDKLTYILDIEQALIHKFRIFDTLNINQEIEYDFEPYIVTSIYYMVKTVTNQNYLVQIDDETQKKPTWGSRINGKIVKSVSVHQFTLQTNQHQAHFSFFKLTELDINDIEEQDTADFDTPVPSESVVININDNTHREKINKINLSKILETFQDKDVLRIGDIYITLKSDIDQQSFLKDIYNLDASDNEENGKNDKNKIEDETSFNCYSIFDDFKNLFPSFLQCYVFKEDSANVV